MGILFVFFGLGLGSIVKEINKKTSIPFTPLMFLSGVILGNLNLIKLIGNYYT